MKILLGVAIFVLVLAAGTAVALYTGMFPTGSSNAAVTGGSSPQPAASTPSARPSSQPGAQAQAGAPQSPAAQSGPQPQVTKQEAYGDWVFTCVALPDGSNQRCSIVQQISDSNTKSVLFVWRIVQNNSGGIVGIWQTPDQVMLTAGVRLEVGTPEPVVIPFETCGRGRCQAVATLADDFLATLAESKEPTVTLVGRNGKGVKLALSVNGLTDGIAALRAEAPPPAPGAPAPAQ